MVKQKITPLSAHEDEARILIQSLRNAARVFEDILEDKITPKTVDVARESLSGILNPNLEEVMSFTAGVRTGAYHDKPEEISSLIREELSQAIEEIQNGQKQTTQSRG